MKEFAAAANLQSILYPKLVYGKSIDFRVNFIVHIVLGSCAWIVHHVDSHSRFLICSESTRKTRNENLRHMAVNLCLYLQWRPEC